MAIRNVSLKPVTHSVFVTHLVVKYACLRSRTFVDNDTNVYRDTPKCHDQSQTGNDKDKDESICVTLQLEEISVTMLRYSTYKRIFLILASFHIPK